MTKDRFVIVDAVGVTDNPLCQATPLNRDPENRLSLQQLLSRAARLSLDETRPRRWPPASTPGRQITDSERDDSPRPPGRHPPRSRSAIAIAVDAQCLTLAADQGGEDAVAERLRDAAQPLADNPELRALIIDIRRKHDQLRRQISRDQITHAEAVPREQIARNTVESFAPTCRTTRTRSC